MFHPQSGNKLVKQKLAVATGLEAAVNEGPPAVLLTLERRASLIQMMPQSPAASRSQPFLRGSTINSKRQDLVGEVNGRLGIRGLPIRQDLPGGRMHNPHILRSHALRQLKRILNAQFRQCSSEGCPKLIHPVAIGGRANVV